MLIASRQTERLRRSLRSVMALLTFNCLYKNYEKTCKEERIFSNGLVENNVPGQISVNASLSILVRHSEGFRPHRRHQTPIAKLLMSLHRNYVGNEFYNEFKFLFWLEKRNIIIQKASPISSKTLLFFIYFLILSSRLFRYWKVWRLFI